MNYTLPTEADLPELTEWVSKDPYHKDIITADHFMPKPDKDGNFENGIVYLKVSDEAGTVFYLRLSNVMRTEVQFSPDATSERMRDALRKAFSFVSAKARSMGYREMIFDSVSQHLISFFDKLGFEPIKNHYKISLP